MRQTTTININSVKYTVTTEPGLFLRLGTHLAEKYPGKKVAVITDDTVRTLYGEQLSRRFDSSNIRHKIISLPPGEKSKSFDILPGIYSSLLEYQLTRNDLILAFGGGVIGDIAGFAAATFLRGVHLINLPTTLMAMVDSSIGGKNGANLIEGNNMAGTFYQPAEVLIDPEFVLSLPDAILADGMAEVIKYGCVLDADLFSDLRVRASKGNASGIENLIYRCCLIKKQVIEQDCRDNGISMLLNFGHTLGHCIEDTYPEGTYTHGQAVAIGMYSMAAVGEKKGLTAPGTARHIMELLDAYDLPHELPPSADKLKILDGVRHDKKRRGDILNIVLLEEIGKGFVYKLDKTDFADFMNL